MLPDIRTFEKYFELEDSPDLLMPNAYEHIEEDEKIGDPYYSQDEVSNFLLGMEAYKNRTQNAEEKKDKRFLLKRRQKR